MVDQLSKYRMYSYGYTAVTPRTAVPTLRELYHETNRSVLGAARKDRPVHDCRAEVIKKHTASERWDAWLLSHGLRSTYDDVLASHEKRDTDTPSSKKQPDKLLYQVGKRGSGNGEFSFPRGLCATLECDIILADSHNHRVQILNQFGVFKRAFGRRGSGPGEFNEPTDVAELPNGDIAVADRRNKRVQVFSEVGEFLSQHPIRHEPYSLACDQQYNLVVCTMDRTLELFTEMEPVTTFPIPISGGGGGQRKGSPLHVGISEQEEIFVSDPADQHIKVFNFSGDMLRQFQPQSHAGGLACSLGGIFVSVLGQVLVADTLNHSVSLFTDTGTFLKQVAVPLDEVGCVHSLAVGPEGHLIVSEFSMTGPHCVKIFRYRECPCHEGKVLSSRKRTPVASPDA
ncbi:uncharacterized protein LOC143282769 [Babylonia areolata]|uniref:uncharacterized protein LOC143282769 n=1 Tax=Babylonia areolata TaxID=304850 RepID=UPI003FD131E9